MTKYRVGWAAGLLLCIIGYLFTDSFAGLYIVAGTFLLLVCSALVTLLNSNGPAAVLDLPGNCRKRQQITGKLILKNSKMPVFKVQADLKIRNLLSGEELTQRIMTGVSSRQDTIVEFAVESAFCGCIQVSVTSVTIYDIFGVFKKTFAKDEKCEMLVLPDLFNAEIQLMPGMLADNESIEYSSDKAGEDVSEIFGIREYMAGDSIKNIHWKLTSKYDELMVRLPSLPLENSVLLMMETSGEESSPQVYDALAEIYITFSQNLLQNDIAHEIAWYDHRDQLLFCFDIEREDDLLGAIGKILSASHSPDEQKVYQHYGQEHGEVGKAHLVYITQEYAEGINELSDEIRKTTVVCNHDSVAAGDGTTYNCTPGNYIQQLHYVNI